MMMFDISSCELKVAEWRKYYWHLPSNPGVINQVNDFLKLNPCINIIQAGSSDSNLDGQWTTHFWLLYDDNKCKHEF